MRQLNQSEIEVLFDFTRKKRVRYKDVQYEIVDHLASDIEEQMNRDESINFERGLVNAYEKFPITGFAHFVQEKSEALSKYWRRHFIRYFMDFVSLPKIIISIFLITTFYYLFRLQGSSAFSVVYIIYLITLFCSGIIYFRKNRKARKNNENYLFLQSYNSIVGMLVYFVTYLPCVVPNTIRFGFEMNHQFSLICAFIMTAFAIIIYACLFVFPKKLKDEIDLKYQHLSFT